MSGNIKDTNVDLVKTQVTSFINDLNNAKIQKTQIDKEVLKKKYILLYNTSNTLFNFIFDNYGTEKFHPASFYNNLTTMLNLICKIQVSDTTQEKASVLVGKKLATQFVPQCKE